MSTLIWVFGVGIVLFIAFLLYVRVYPNFVRPKSTLVTKAPIRKTGSEILIDEDFGIRGIVLSKERKGLTEDGVVKWVAVINTGSEAVPVTFFDFELEVESPANSLCSGSPAIYKINRRRGEKDGNTNIRELVWRANENQRRTADLTANQYELLDDAFNRAKEIIVEKQRSRSFGEKKT